jgi:hypothetical protein
MRNRLNHWIKRLLQKRRFVPVDLVPAVLILKTFHVPKIEKSVDYHEL